MSELPFLMRWITWCVCLLSIPVTYEMSLFDIDHNSMSDRKRPTARPHADGGRMETYGKAH
jgi:hypothetical protein